MIPNKIPDIDPKDYRDSLEYCPHCNANLQGDPIAPESQHLFAATHFSRKIGVYDLERDRTVCWQCPDCGGEWGR